MVKGEWLRPLSSRGESGEFDLQFLWRSGTTYVMDNHLAAGWCWLQHLHAGASYNLLHVDAHYDLFSSNIAKWVSSISGSLRAMSLDDYTSQTCGMDGYPVKVFRWDNYTPILMNKEPSLLRRGVFVTQRADSYLPETIKSFEAFDDITSIADLTNVTVAQLRSRPYIFNLDLDFFFTNQSEPSGSHRRRWSDAKTLEAVRSLAAYHREAVLTTICLSPECCGGWPAAEKLLKDVCREFGITFQMPTRGVR